MRTPFLLALTQRLENRDHPLLVSRGASLDEGQARGFIQRAEVRAQETGTDAVEDSDFAAVLRRGVFQASSDRLGDEVLLLGGIDADALDERQRGTIRHHLLNLLDKLPELITKAGSPQAATTPATLESDELDAWLQSTFPAEVLRPPEPRAPRVKRSHIALITLLVILLASVVIWACSSHPLAPPNGSAHDTVKDKPKDKDKAKTGEVDPEKLFSKFLENREWEDQRNKVRSELAYLLHADPSNTAEKNVVQNHKIQALMEDPESVLTDAYYFTGTNTEAAKGLRRLTGGDGQQVTRDEVRKCQRLLAKVGARCHAFRRRALLTGQIPTLDGYSLLQSVSKLAQIEDLDKLPEGEPVERLLPLFNKRDEIAARAAQLLTDLVQNGSDDSRKVVGLKNLCEELKTHLDEITAGIDKDNASYWDSSPVVSEGNVVDRLTIESSRLVKALSTCQERPSGPDDRR